MQLIEAARRLFLLDGAETRIAPMEGLRGLAAFAIFLVHYVTLSEPWIDGDSRVSEFAVGLHGFCNAGVDLFFALSGFLIYGALIDKPRPFVPYISRRAWRIYPTAAVVLAVYLAASLLVPGKSKIPSEDTALIIVQNLLLLPGVFSIPLINPVAWSLSYEMAFYLLLPIAIALLMLRRRTSGQRTVIILALAAAYILVTDLLDGPVRAVCFGAGMILRDTLGALSVQAAKRLSAPALAVSVVLMAAVWILRGDPELAAWVEPFNGVLRYSLLFAAFYLLLLVCFTPGGAAYRALSWTPLRIFGNFSYSYYLIHGLGLHAFFLVLQTAAPPEGAWSVEFFLLMPLAFAATVPVAVALFLLVEKPVSLRVGRAQPPQHARGVA